MLFKSFALRRTIKTDTTISRYSLIKTPELERGERFKEIIKEECEGGMRIRITL